MTGGFNTQGRLAACLDEIRMEAMAGRRDPAAGASDRALLEIVRLAELGSSLAARSTVAAVPTANRAA